jgi:transcriptional regulator with XRE-family HTH domain
MKQDRPLPFSGELLRERREDAGLTRPGLADVARTNGDSISHQHIRRLELGENVPLASTVRVLARALGCRVTDLYDKTQTAPVGASTKSGVA